MNNHSEFCDYDDCNCDDGENEEQKVLMLTRDEALYIDDQLTMMIEQQDKLGNFATVRPLASTAGLPAPVDLLDKIAMAVLQTTDPDAIWEAEAKIFVSATDLYMLREVAKSNVKINNVYVGFNLKRKIYQLLYENEYQRDRQVEKLLSDVNVEENNKIVDWSGE